MKLSKTECGFELVTFEDCIEQKCVIQQGIHADDGSQRLWLGLDGKMKMHLDKEQVTHLVKRLTKWVKCNTLRLTSDPKEKKKRVKK